MCSAVKQDESRLKYSGATSNARVYHIWCKFSICDGLNFTLGIGYSSISGFSVVFYFAYIYSGLSIGI